MNKKISLGAAIFFMAIVAAITFCFTMLFSQNVFNGMVSNVSEREVMYERIGEIDTMVSNHYLFPMEEEQIQHGLADGLTDALNDPYAEYFNQEEYDRKLLEDQGQLVGIGVTCTIDPASGYFSIVSVVEGSPAEAAGMLAGDRIISLDGTDLLEVADVEKVSELMRGEAGTKVTVVTRRDGTDTTLELTRKEIALESVSFTMLDQNAYIILDSFTGSTPAQFEDAIDQAIEEGAKGLILDLRSNGGGQVDATMEMLDLLLPEGVIATATDKSGTVTVLAESDEEEIDLPMVMLINDKTASSAELFVQALKDYSKGVAVGVNSYGKGVMQTTYPLESGGAIKFTTAYLNPPVSDNFNEVGVRPEYEIALSAEQELLLAQGDLPMEEDVQLAKAIEVLNSTMYIEP